MLYIYVPPKAPLYRFPDALYVSCLVELSLLPEDTIIHDGQ